MALNKEGRPNQDIALLIITTLYLRNLDIIDL